MAYFICSICYRPYPFDKDGDSSICNELDLIENKVLLAV